MCKHTSTSIPLWKSKDDMRMQRMEVSIQELQRQNQRFDAFFGEIQATTCHQGNRIENLQAQLEKQHKEVEFLRNDLQGGHPQGRPKRASGPHWEGLCQHGGPSGEASSYGLTSTPRPPLLQGGRVAMCFAILDQLFPFGQPSLVSVQAFLHRILL